MPLLPHAEPLFPAGSSSAVLALHGLPGQPHSMRPSARCLRQDHEQRRDAAHAATSAQLDNDAEAIFAGSLESIRGCNARTAALPAPAGQASGPATSPILRQHQ